MPAYLTRAGDTTLYLLAGAYHNSNVAPTRARLWDRLAAWASAVTAPPAAQPLPERQP